MYRQYYDSPLTKIIVRADEVGISHVEFLSCSEQPLETERASPITEQACQQLDRYFNGSLRCFSVPLSLHGTEFQQSVWHALEKIGYAQTVSYRYIASKVGNTKAVRAVGMANGKNPIAIIVPCHRVIGANGKLTGYASGLDKKQWLLDHEARNLQQ